MHEFSLMKGLMSKIETIAHEEKAERVTGVRVKLGALAHMSPDHFREHFETVSQGTLAEGAELFVTLDENERDPDAQGIFLQSVDVDG